MYSRLGFGLSPAAARTVGIPTRARRRGLDLAVIVDGNGFDEMWFGEHHGLGWEISGSPEIMIAAAERTTRIKVRLA